MNIFLRTFDLYLIMDHTVACKRFYFNYGEINTWLLIKVNGFLKKKKRGGRPWRSSGEDSALTSTAGDVGLIPGWETKILHASNVSGQEVLILKKKGEHKGPREKPWGDRGRDWRDAATS